MKQTSSSELKRNWNGPMTATYHNCNTNENGEINIINQAFNIRKIDFIGLCVVVVLFLLFNVIYWVTLVIVANQPRYE